ncbi:MAG: rod shape-determining protein MreC [Armatimonadota bacterium]
MHSRSIRTNTPFIVRDVVHIVLTPVNIAAHRMFGVGDWLFRVVRPRRLILRENTTLRREVQRLTLENARLADAAAENSRLRELLGLKQSIPMRTVAAEVISRKPSNWFDTVIVNRGRRHGIGAGDPVVNFRGLIGQVTEADLLSARVVSITDPSSAVGAMVRRSRASGILLGQGGEYLSLTYLPKDADVKASDIVITSGIGRVIPKGFVIGRVVKVNRDITSGMTTALVRPSVRFDEIEHVLVVTRSSGQ